MESSNFLLNFNYIISAQLLLAADMVGATWLRTSPNCCYSVLCPCCVLWNCNYLKLIGNQWSPLFLAISISFSLCSFPLSSLGSQFLHRLAEEFISVSIKGRWPDPFLLSLTGLELPSLFSATTDVAITARAGHSGDLM